MALKRKFFILKWRLFTYCCISAPGPGEKLDTTGGFFLDDSRYVLPLAIDHVILDMRLRPWVVTILIDKSINDLVAPPTTPKSSGGVKPLPTVPEIQLEVEPKSTCGALLLQVLRRFFGDRGCEVEELAFFMEKEKKPTDKTGKASASGVWLESTARLADYGHEVTKVCYLICLCGCSLTEGLDQVAIEKDAKDFEDYPCR